MRTIEGDVLVVLPGGQPHSPSSQLCGVTLASRARPGARSDRRRPNDLGGGHGGQHGGGHGVGHHGGQRPVGRTADSSPRRKD
jgi:hypothetical protein